MKVQIVDPSEEFCKSLKARLPNTFTVDICTDSDKAFSRIVEFCPDILVIASHLPGRDGLYILQAVRSAGVDPVVLLASLLEPDESIAAFKIDDIFIKPCEMNYAAGKVMELVDKVENKNTSTRKWIRNFLLGLDFQSNLCGYKYIFVTLELLSEDPDQQLSKVIYPAVAKEFGGSWRQIERGIRSSVEDSWDRHTGEMWDAYFPDQKKRPSNSVFLSRAIQLLYRGRE